MATQQVGVTATEFRARRKALRLTQQDLADLAGVSPRFIHDLESGKPTVQLDRLLAVATALGLELHWQVAAAGTLSGAGSGLDGQ
ncbi:MAG TPA: helix-turn-helix transcriptional regulator [Trueperaceae bacterium]|nr:helix-turn-helix transcriptional regulator [Trueperaceae bacterium]